MSVDRPRTRYRTLSAVAANVAAAAAALAAQQDEVREHSVQGSRLFRSPRDAEGSTSRMTRNTDEDQVDDGAMGALADSFHSEGGRTIGRKRVSWSKERYGGRAGSVGRQPQLLQGGLVPMSSAEPVPTGPSSGRGRPETATLDSTASLRHSSVASRQGAGLAFLSVFALFSVGTLVQQRSNKGSVLVPRAVEVNPGAFSLDDNRSGVPHPPFPIDLADPDKISDAFSPHSDEGTHTDTIYISSPPHIPQNEPVSIAETPRDRILGRIFAWLCTTLYLTSRLPQIWKNFVRKSVEGLSMYLFVFAFLGNTFYVASILTSPKVYQPLPASREFIKESMPYLLGSGGTLMFDITIVMQSFIYRSKPRRHTRSTSRTIVEEERGLLAGDSLAHPPYNANNSTLCSSNMQHNAPDALRALVLDYLTHSGYIRSAQAFLRDSAVRHIDVDGDEIMDSDTDPGGSGLPEETVRQAELRNQIRYELLRGRVTEAIELLTKHFPTVLPPPENTAAPSADSDSDQTTESPPRPMPAYVAPTSVDPLHLLLNLRVQAFIESCRTVPLDYPPNPESNSLQSRSEEDPDISIDQQTALLKSAQKLSALAKTLSDKDQPRYSVELKNVIGLIAYRKPETSPLKNYMTQERREALADQINSAILFRSELPVISKAELHTRTTVATWQFLHEIKVKPKAGAAIPPLSKSPKTNASKGTDSLEPQICPPFDFQAFLNN
uniref:CRA domain-containing protein n=1 Tax=Moniliophthora roreri TaxID=221103 RepID=A0A0W0FLH5_MONRR